LDERSQDENGDRAMSEAQSPREDEETMPASERDESKWSPWERQKLEVYGREHPDEEPVPAPVEN
jgi:hypothetical protein